MCRQKGDLKSGRWQGWWGARKWGLLATPRHNSPWSLTLHGTGSLYVLSDKGHTGWVVCGMSNNHAPFGDVVQSEASEHTTHPQCSCPVCHCPPVASLQAPCESSRSEERDGPRAGLRSVSHPVHLHPGMYSHSSPGKPTNPSL